MTSGAGQSGLLRRTQHQGCLLRVWPVRRRAGNSRNHTARELSDARPKRSVESM